MVRILLLFITGCAAGLLGQSVSEPNGVSISVTNAGVFTIESGGWNYSGTITGRVSGITGPVSGTDNNAVSTNGAFDQFTADYSDPDGNPWRMQLRAYHSSPSATVSFSPLADVPNVRPYAILHQFPVTPHHFSNAGWNHRFGLIGWLDTDSPWLFFDDQFRASILSPASRPISERQAWVFDGSTNGLIALEIDSSNPILPAGDVYSYLITFGQGIANTFHTWGSTLRNIDGRPYTSSLSDWSLIMPMLSTDAGAKYYYVFNNSLGYEGTLQAALASAKAADIPIGMVHFDSWWYLKGGNCDAPLDASAASWKNGTGGVWEFVTDPSFFPYINPSDPSEGFVQHLGRGMAHGRWIDSCSPYRLSTGPNQAVSGNVIVDPGLWQTIADSIKRSGMIIYEQDFLANNARAANTFDDERFLNAMSSAMTKDGIFLQFCMPLARHLLEAIQMPSVHTLRVSGDRFGWNHWDTEMYGAMVLNAGSVWPTVDNFQTTETKNLLLAVLSAGPLALADPIGNFVPIPEAIRSDGLILKPDASMVPSDATFVADADATEQFYGISGSTASNAGNKGQLIFPTLIGHTYSDFGASKVGYVFAYTRELNATAPVSFTPQDFGFNGTVYVYDYFGKAGWTQPASQSITRPVDSQGSYFVIAAVGPSGMAFLGDPSRFATASKQRFATLSDQGQIVATMHFAPGESVPVAMFAPATPLVSADGAAVSAPVYNSSTGLYTVTVTSQQNEATIHITPREPHAIIGR